MTLEDETGQRKTMHAGDTFVVYRGSVIKFTTDDYGIAWKCSARNVCLRSSDGITMMEVPEGSEMSGERPA
jgi:hypothetical protein